MISIYEVGLTLLFLLCALWSRFKFSEIEVRIKGEASQLEENMSHKTAALIERALSEFEHLADEVIPDNPDPFEAMEIMRANMVNQVLGMGVQWFADKFTKVQMGVHQLENVNSPDPDSADPWHDVEHVQNAEPVGHLGDLT